MDMHYGVQCTAFWAIGVLFRLQIGLENRFKDQLQCRLHHPSSDCTLCCW